jgi:hypothetical protein
MSLYAWRVSQKETWHISNVFILNRCTNWFLPFNMHNVHSKLFCKHWFWIHFLNAVFVKCYSPFLRPSSSVSRTSTITFTHATRGNLANFYTIIVCVCIYTYPSFGAGERTPNKKVGGNCLSSKPPKVTELWIMNLLNILDSNISIQ